MKTLVIQKLKLVSYLIEIRQLHQLELMFKTMCKNRVQKQVQNFVQNHVQNHVQNRVRKIKKIANKNMSFLKITDPKKRDFIVNEFLKTRQNIQQNFLSERVDDLSTQYERSKLLKPITDMHKYLKGLVSELKPLREGMKNVPKAITFPQFPSIQPMLMMMVKKRRIYS